MPSAAFKSVRVFSLLVVLTAFGTQFGCAAHSKQEVNQQIEQARQELAQAREAGAREHAENLYFFAEDLIDQAEAALARDDRKQAMLAAELAVEKAGAARKKALEARDGMPAGEGDEAQPEGDSAAAQ